MGRQDQLIEFVTQDIIEMLTIDKGIENDESKYKYYH